jgi:glycosyltransferase involved in cell wall biosynthesis
VPPAHAHGGSLLRLDLVVPAHNEEHRIDDTLTDYRNQLTSPDVRFLVALDGCEDATSVVVDRHAEADPRVGWISFPKLGKGGVLAEAFRASAGGDADVVAFVDADGATPPTELLRLVRAVEDGADVAIGSRRHPAALSVGPRPWVRRLTSSGFAFGIRRLFSVPFADTQCGAKVVRADLVRRVAPLLSARDFLFDVDLLHTSRRLGYQVVEVPTVWIDQEGSRVRPARDAVRMLGSSVSLWLHHRMIPIDGDRRDVVRTRRAARRSIVTTVVVPAPEQVDGLTSDHNRRTNGARS